MKCDPKGHCSAKYKRQQLLQLQPPNVEFLLSNTSYCVPSTLIHIVSGGVIIPIGNCQHVAVVFAIILTTAYVPTYFELNSVKHIIHIVQQASTIVYKHHPVHQS